MTRPQSFPHFCSELFLAGGVKNCSKNKQPNFIQSYSDNNWGAKFLFLTGRAPLSFAFSFYWDSFVSIRDVLVSLFDILFLSKRSMTAWLVNQGPSSKLDDLVEQSRNRPVGAEAVGDDRYDRMTESIRAPR